MSNKTSDENVAKIEEDIKLVKRYLENSAYKETDSDFFKNGGWEMVDLEIPKAMANILAELEQKDKRIEELEEELEKANRQLDLDYVDENYIPKQVVIDELQRLKNMFKATTQGILQEYTVNEIIIRSNTLQELLEGEIYENKT